MKAELLPRGLLATYLNNKFYPALVLGPKSQPLQLEGWGAIWQEGPIQGNYGSSSVELSASRKARITWPLRLRSQHYFETWW